jgi:hypothetical protein
MHMRADIDVGALESELRRNLRGEIRFSDGDRALYSTDSSNYRQIPIGVVIPRQSRVAAAGQVWRGNAATWR